jgi:hypothetical protein
MLREGIGAVGGRVDASDPTSMTYVRVLATMTIVDTDAHGPAIQIRALDDDGNASTRGAAMAASSAMREYVASGRPWWEDLRDRPPCAIVPLYMIDRIASGWTLSGGMWNAGGVVRLYAAPSAPSSSSSSSSSASSGAGFITGMLMNATGFGRELLRFDPLSRGGRADSESNDDVDDVIVGLKSLVDWNRRRLAKEIEEGRAMVVPKRTPASSPGYVAIS